MSPRTMLMQFLLGYLAVLAAPGPNMLAIGTLTTLRGLRGALPFLLGIAAGAGALALALLVAFAAVEESVEAERAARAVGGALLLLMALRIMRTPHPVVRAAGGSAPRAGLVDVAAGFCTAATNPITAAYFAAQFLGPFGEAWPAPCIVPLVAAQALGFGLLVAAVFARPAVRRIALARHRTICVGAGLALALLAFGMLRPVLHA